MCRRERERKNSLTGCLCLFPLIRSSAAGGESSSGETGAATAQQSTTPPTPTASLEAGNVLADAKCRLTQAKAQSEATKKSCCGRAGVRSASGKSQKERAAESGRVEKKTAAAAARGGQKRPQPQRIGKRIERRRRGSQCIFLLLLLAVHCSSSSGSCGACVSQPVCLCAC